MDEIRELLIHEQAWLRAIREQLVEQPQDQAKQKPLPPTIQETVQEPSPNERDELKEIQAKKTEAFSEMNRLHAQLQLLPSDEERRLAALRILQLDEAIQAYWKQIHHYEKHGELPKRKLLRGEPDFEHDSQAELIRKRNNARSYISKATNRIKHPEKVNMRKQWIEQINQFLGNEFI
ncbi:MAG: hypothetical protein ACPGJS_00565 [Flammeovirgaceae bacterium]